MNNESQQANELRQAIKEQGRHISSLRGGYGATDAIQALDELTDTLYSQVAELTNKLSAAELTAIRVSANLGEAKMQLRNVDAMLAKERQAGRDEVLKELSKQAPYAHVMPLGLPEDRGNGLLDTWSDKVIPLIIRPQPPKEQS